MPRPHRTSASPSLSRRLRTTFSLAVLPVALLAGDAVRAPSRAEAAPFVSGVRALTRAGEARPWLYAGTLTPPSTRAAEPIAREAIALHAPSAIALGLVARATATLPGGVRVVAFDQRIDGVPVLGRGARVIVEADGRATRLITSLEEQRPASMLARVDETGARRAAGLLAERTKVTAIVWPTGDEPRLAWLVEGATRGTPQRPVAVIDATTGEPIARWNAARAMGQAKVYPQNPVKTPTLVQVTVPADSGKEGLQNELVVGRNCIDKGTLRPVNLGQNVNLHVCDLIPTITPDATGDYLSIAPATDKAPEDAYAELSMFWHANVAWSAAKAMGFAPADVTAPIVAIANFRMNHGLTTGDVAQMQNAKLALDPYDNAFFASAGQFGSIFGEDGDALWFGQGTRVDFGYDGDVVYHEFGHFMVEHTLKLVSFPHRDPYGLSMAPGAMNEGIADLFSCFVTGDPAVGEYAGKGLQGKPIRQLDGFSAIPRNLSGEEHEDSLPFSQPIWTTYAALDAGQQEGFRKAFLEAMVSSPTGDLGYADFAQLLETTVEARVDAASAKALKDAFLARGISPNEPRVIDVDGSPLYGTSWTGFLAPSRSTAGVSPFAPGIMQMRYPARAGSYVLHVTWNYQQTQGAFGSSGLFSTGGKYLPQLLVKIGSTPIKFASYSPTKHDAQLATCTDFGDSVDCAAPVEVPDADGGQATVYLMPVNAGTLDVDIDAISVAAPLPPKADAGVPTPDAGDPDGGVTNGLDGAQVGGAGCACRTGGASDDATSRSAGGLAALGLAALSAALLVRRRRPPR